MEDEYFEDVYYKLIAAIFVTIAFLSFTLNLAVLVTFATNKSLRTAYNILLISMAVTDLLSSLATSLGAYANFVLFWTLDPFWCQCFAFLSTFCGLCSIWSHVALAVERLVRIKWSLLQIVKRRNIAIVLTSFGLLSLAFSIFPLIGWGSYSPEPGFAGCSVTWYSSRSHDIAYTMTLFALFFFVPIVVMTTCYVSVHRELKSMTEKAKSSWGKESDLTTGSVLAKAKNCKLSLVMSLAFIFAWSPYAFVSLYRSFGGSIPVSFVVVLPAMFAKFSAIYNSLIYFFMYRKFRAAFVSMMSRLVKILRSLHCCCKRSTKAMSRESSVSSKRQLKVVFDV